MTQPAIAVKWTKVVDLRTGAQIAVATKDLRSAHFVKIVRVIPFPPEPVYDIEVEGTHNFVANGIIAHNTYLKGATADTTTAALNTVNSAATSLLYVRNDGNVGIGTPNPGAKLDVAGGDVAIQTAQKVILDSNDTGDASSNTYLLHDATNDRVSVYVDGIEMVRMNK